MNNAGYGLLGAIEEATEDEVERLFAVNVHGPRRVIQAALPFLRAQGRGHIVNITSIAGLAPMSGSGLYAAAKSAVEGLSSALAQEVGPLGIRVTAVAPGGFRTDFLSAHSIRTSPLRVAAYEVTVGASLRHLDEIAGQQIGDPDRGAAAILAVVSADDPPTHLVLGSDAVRRTREQQERFAAELDRWEAVSLSTDYPPAAARGRPAPGVTR